MSAKVLFVPFSPTEHAVIAETIAKYGIDKTREMFREAFEPSVLDAVLKAVVRKHWGKK